MTNNVKPKRKKIAGWKTLPNDSSCYFLILITATLLSQIISFISFDRSNNFLQPIFVYNIEALAQDEGYNKGDKLKSVTNQAFPWNAVPMVI